MKTKQATGVREDSRTGQYVPTLDGKDISPTSFDETRALQIAHAAADAPAQAQPRVTQSDIDKSLAGKQAQHSPLPWEHNRTQPFTNYKGEHETGHACAIYSGDAPICTTNFSVGKYKAVDSDTQDANAAFIVRACNNVQRLADDMREIRDMAKNRSRVNMQNGVSLAAFAACSLAQWEGGAKVNDTGTPAGCHYNERGAVAIEECGCCDQYHRVAFYGDCRNDNERFADPEDAEQRLGKPTFIVSPEEVK